jgi:hypothetical protein
MMTETSGVLGSLTSAARAVGIAMLYELVEISATPW